MKKIIHYTPKILSGDFTPICNGGLQGGYTVYHDHVTCEKCLSILDEYKKNSDACMMKITGKR